MSLENEMPQDDRKKARWMAAGGILAALGASSCCILPLVLFSLGVSGAWVGNLTALAPLKPYFITAAVGLLAYGFYMVYRTPKCKDGAMCARIMPGKLVKAALWAATFLITVAMFWTWIAPVIAPLMLGL